MSISSPEGQPPATVSFAGIRTNTDFADAVRSLIESLPAAGLDPSAAEDAESSLALAVREAHMPVPNKWAVVDHLDDASTRLAGAPQAAGIVRALEEASETARGLF